MTKHTILVAALLLFTFSPLQAQDGPETSPQFTGLPAAPLAYVDDTILTVGDFGDYLYKLGVTPTGRRQQDLDSLRSCLQRLIDEVIIILDMDSAAILSDVESARRMRRRVAQRTGPVITRRVIFSRVTVSREEIEQFYHDSLEVLFTAPSRREVRHLLVAPNVPRDAEGRRVRRQEHWDTARATADSLKQVIAAGASFATIAGTWSDDTESKENGGYLGWVYPGNTVHDFDTATFSASPGELRGPIKTIYGYHILRVEGIRPESTLVLNDTISLRIERAILIDKVKKQGNVWADSAMDASHWEFNDPALNRMPDLDAETWVVSVNRRDTLWWSQWHGAWEFFKRSADIQGDGTLEDKHASLKQTAFPYIYIQAAEDRGFADDSAIVAERRQYLVSESLRLRRGALRDYTTPPPRLIDMSIGLEEDPPIAKPLNLQYLRARDTTDVWNAYRRLYAGDDMATVVRWYHDNLREVRAGDWDLGWVGPDALPEPLWARAWILEPGRFTRPVEYEGKWYIMGLKDRRNPRLPLERRAREVDSIKAAWRVSGLQEWREDLRRGHTIRINRSYWDRVQQLWRR